MLEQQLLFPALESLAFVGGGDGSMVLDHEIVFVSRHLLEVVAVACPNSHCR